MQKINSYYLPDSDTYFKSYFEKDDGFQLDHLKRILEEVTDFSCAIDGGAHVGSWAKLMAAHFQEVHAFEPATDTFNCLYKNVRGIKNIVARNCALGETLGYINVYDDVSREGNTGARYIMQEPVKPGFNFYDSDDRGKLLMVTLDQFFFERLGLLKLDLEGYEYYALLGAKQTIERCKPVVVIEKKNFKERYAHNFKDAEKLLVDLGMSHVHTIGNDAIYKFI